MKRCLTLACLICLGLLWSGCDRSEPDKSSPDVFDPESDPHVSVLNTAVNPDLLDDQRSISSRYERDRENPKTEETKTQPDTESSAGVDDVKQAVANVIDAVKAGNPERSLDLFTQQDADLLRPLISGPAALQAKLEQLEELLASNLSMILPDETKSALSDKTAGIAPHDIFAATTVEELGFEQDGQEVVMTGPDEKAIRFSWIDAEYKAYLAQEDRSVIELAVKLLEAQQSMADQIIAGIKSRQITARRFDSRVRRIKKRTLDSAMGAFMSARMSLAQPGDAMDASETTEAEPNEPTRAPRRRRGGFRNITDPLNR